MVHRQQPVGPMVPALPAAALNDGQSRGTQTGGDVGFVLWIAAVILVIVGIVQLFQGQILFGILLIIVGCLVGPGGYSIFRRR